MSFNPDAGTISGASDAALSNPTADQRLSYDEGTGKWVNQTTTIGVVTGLQEALDDKLDKKNDVVELTDSSNDSFARVNITDDATPTAGWSDRLAFYFNGTRSGYFNEYGELRARPAKANTVALRAMSRSDAANDNDVFQVAELGSSSVVFGVAKKYLTNNGLIKNNTYASNPGGAYIERTDLNYSTTTGNPDLEQIWANGVRASWRNEWGALRGTAPYTWGDALVRAIRDSNDIINTSPNQAAFEIADRRGETPVTTWGRTWHDGSLIRNGNQMADTYVMENGGTPPSNLPVGTVIIELDE